LYVCIRIHPSFFILNFMLPACGQNFAEAVRIVWKIEQVWFNASPYAKNQRIIFCAEQYLTTITVSLFPRNLFQVGYLLHLARWLGEIFAEKYRKVEICLNPKLGTRLKWVLNISRQISLPTRKEPPRYELRGPKSHAKLWEEDCIPSQGCTNPERQVTRATKLYTVGREYITWFILRRLLDLWEVCVPNNK